MTEVYILRRILSYGIDILDTFYKFQPRDYIMFCANVARIFEREGIRFDVVVYGTTFSNLTKKKWLQAAYKKPRPELVFMSVAPKLEHKSIKESEIGHMWGESNYRRRIYRNLTTSDLVAFSSESEYELVFENIVDFLYKAWKEDFIFDKEQIFYIAKTSYDKQRKITAERTKKRIDAEIDKQLELQRARNDMDREIYDEEERKNTEDDIFKKQDRKNTEGDIFKNEKTERPFDTDVFDTEN